MDNNPDKKDGSWRMNYNTLEMSVLHKISKALVHQTSINNLLQDVLEILDKEMGLLRATITLRQGDLLIIEAAHGLTEEEIKRGVYRIGEGVTGNVAAHSKSRIIYDISESNEFLDRTKTRLHEKNIAFLCVPIIYQEQVIGTLSIDKKTTDFDNLKRELYLLETLANIIAEAVSVLFLQKKEHEKLLEENKLLRLELSQKNIDGIIGKCSSMRLAINSIFKFAQTESPVLLRGETGTGKKLAAKAIVSLGKRKDAPFLSLNCRALSPSLVELELFGAKRFSLSKAESQKVGLLEQANKGALFIDKIGELNLETQEKLLRFLQDKTFHRLGEKTLIKSDVRIIASSGKNLEELVAAKKFNAELYARLNPYSIYLPSLFERRSDILLLAEYFIAKFNRLHKKKIKRISRPAINMLLSYFWPSNVRELENCIESAVLNANEVIYSYNLPPTLQTSLSTNTAKLDPNAEVDFSACVRSFEREMICEALKIHRGNASAAARHLSLSQRVMNYKIKNLSIDAKSFKKYSPRRKKINVKSLS